MYDEPTLTDKVALVFGGSRGIGAAIVRRLAANGASVALTYANSAEKAGLPSITSSPAPPRQT
jgi:3-oxoacyl-[acyl-carrier protein] reductase